MPKATAAVYPGASTRLDREESRQLPPCIRCGSIRCVKTTLDIDNDVLAVIKELASSRRTTAGKIISELARKGLQANRADQTGVIQNGFELLPTANEAVTKELVEKLLEEED